MPLNFKPIDLQRQTEYSNILSNALRKHPITALLTCGDGHKPTVFFGPGPMSSYGSNKPFPKRLIGHRWVSWENIDWEANFRYYLNLLRAYTGSSCALNDLLKFWEKELKEKIKVKETKGAWDYLYAVPELIELKGNRFHKKKNLLNQFKKNYGYHYLPFESALVDSALNMQNDWCTWRDCESSEMLSAENQAISRILESWEKLRHLMGGALFVGGEMVAYTIGERIDAATPGHPF